MLRRNISKLSSELDTNVQYTALSAKSKKTIESREIVERRVAFLEDVLMEKCYLAFSQLVADNQYAALGLMLVGTLARIGKVIAPLRVERTLDGEEVVDGGKHEGAEGQEVLDLGEVVQREEVGDEKGGKGEKQSEDADEDAAALKKSKKKKRFLPADGARGSVMEDSIVTKRPKKKRKKGDAFDDLFAGLV